MRLQKISIFYLVAFFALLSSIGNIWSGENSLAKSTHWPSDGDRVEKKHYEYLGVVNDSLLTWDFSNAVETGTSHSMQWINIGDSVLVKIVSQNKGYFIPPPKKNFNTNIDIILI